MALFCSHSRTARFSTAETDVLRRAASRSKSDLSSVETRQLYTSLPMHYIVVHLHHASNSQLTGRTSPPPAFSPSPPLPPDSSAVRWFRANAAAALRWRPLHPPWPETRLHWPWTVSDRKSTRLNSSHRCISYAVFCLK